MPSFHDTEFGDISYRRHPKASSVRLKVAPDGTLRASLPPYAPLFIAKRLVASSRHQLRQLIAEHASFRRYQAGMQIGKSHSLIVRPTERREPRASTHGLQITVDLPTAMTLDSYEARSVLQKTVAKALRTEARSYLPKRLAFLAKKHGFSYKSIRFSHASGRWGSCSSNGTISLNIALMMLPFELIDYVLLHELSHTRHMDHSTRFWQLVESLDPDFKLHRRLLKAETPSI